MTPKTPDSTINRKALTKIVTGMVQQAGCPHRMNRAEDSLDAFLAPCYSRNRAFRGIWWLIHRILKCPSWKTAPLNPPEAGITELFVKEDSAVATVCEVLPVCAVFGGAKLSLKLNGIFFCWSFDKVLWPKSCMMCLGGTLLSFSLCIIRFRALWLVSRRSKPAFPFPPIGLALNQHLLGSLLWFMLR